MANLNKEAKDNLKEALFSALFKAAGQVLVEMGRAISEVSTQSASKSQKKINEPDIADIDNDDY